MRRAAILIGVSKTGGLPRLEATRRGVRAMREWALTQGMPEDLVKVLTDDNGPVEISDIKKVLNELVDLATVEQLLIYFTGHGVNIRYGEYWLMSGAPGDPQAAVNVEASITLARQCGIPHVVLISDACRTAAATLQDQWISGSEIFPNVGPGGLERAVDAFFACNLGKPSLEIRDPASPEQGFSAVYTDALVEALNGRHAGLLEEFDDRGQVYGLVRPWPLKAHLQTEVVRRLANAGVPAGVTQVPDARITSGEQSWLARHPLPTGLPTREVPVDLAKPEVSLATASHELLRSTLTEGRAALARERLPQGRHTRLLTDVLARTASPFGPGHFETGCGFKVRGARVVRALCLDAEVDAEILGADASLVRIAPFNGPAVQMLLTFADGDGVVLPAIQEFLAGLTYEDGELVDVTYEPSDNSWRWGHDDERRNELRALRSLIASSAELGVFRLAREDALPLAQKLQVLKGVDPTMALYAAYAYRDLGASERIAAMLGFMQGDLQVGLFDVAMLAGAAPHRPPAGRVVPCVPMLSQGWALLNAYGMRLPRSLEGVERHVLPSLWTLFEPAGVEMVLTARARGEIG